MATTNATKLCYNIEKEELINRKVIFMIQPVANNTIRHFFELASTTNTNWVIDKCDNVLIIFKKLS